MFDEPGFARLPADTPIITVVERLREDLRALKSQKETLETRIVELASKLEFLEKYVVCGAGDAVSTSERSQSQIPPLPEEPQRQAPLAEQHQPQTEPATVLAPAEAPRSGPPVHPNEPTIRSIALKLAHERPDGFKASDVVEEFYRLPNVGAGRNKLTVNGFVYRTIKRLRAEGVLEKDRHVFFLRPAGSRGDPSDQPAVIQGGYKIVPLTKAERIRIEAKNYLSRRGGSAHRAEITDHLTSNGIMGGEKRPIEHLSILLSGWPEFHSIGEGKYALAETQEAAK